MIYFQIYFRAYDCPCHCHVHNEGMGITAENEAKAREAFWAGASRNVAEITSVEVAEDWLQPSSNMQASIRKFEAWQGDVSKESAMRAFLLVNKIQNWDVNGGAL